MILGNLPPIHPAPVAQALLPVLLSSFLPRLCSGHFYVGTRGGASGGGSNTGEEYYLEQLVINMSYVLPS